MAPTMTKSPIPRRCSWNGHASVVSSPEIKGHSNLFPKDITSIYTIHYFKVTWGEMVKEKNMAQDWGGKISAQAGNETCYYHTSAGLTASAKCLMNSGSPCTILSGSSATLQSIEVETGYEQDVQEQRAQGTRSGPAG